MPVATNLIRVTRPDSLGLTYMVYYLDDSSYDLHAFEYSIENNEINHYQTSLPSNVNGSPDLNWNASPIIEEINVGYDGDPFVIITSPNGEVVCLWRPKSNSLFQYVTYNITNPAIGAVLVNDSVYLLNPSTSYELIQLSLQMNLIGVVSSTLITLASLIPLVTENSYCLQFSENGYIKMPFNGSTPSPVTLANTVNAMYSSPYKNNMCLLMDGSDVWLSRTVTDDSMSVSYSWPTDSVIPWGRQSVRPTIHYSQGYIACFDSRVIIAPENALSTDDILVLSTPEPKTLSGDVIGPFAASIGNIP